MEKSKLATVTDEIVRALAIWLFALLALRYFIKQLYLLLALATILTAIATLLIRRLQRKKQVDRSKAQRCDDIFNELMVSDRADFTSRLALSVGGENLGDAVVSQKTLIYPYFYGKLSVDKLNYAYNLALKHNKKLLILCRDISPEAEKSLHLFSDTRTAILDKSKAYDFLESHGLAPTIKKRPKKKISLQKKIFKRSKIKGYLTASIVLLITAAFSPYSLLCIIGAAFNIAMSIMCEAHGA